MEPGVPPSNGGNPLTWLEFALQHGRPMTLLLPAAVTAAAGGWVTVTARDMYATAARARGDAAHLAAHMYALGAGYLLVWALFSAAATGLQRLLASALLLTPMMEAASPSIAAAILAVAGVYQMTPLKRACARACRSPLGLMLQRWRSGAAGAFRLGVEHGSYCLGCCWALMLILFAGGVMNLTVILALTVWVLVEKWAPFGGRTTTASGIGLLALAVWIAMR